jgi:hypothetical protein
MKDKTGMEVAVQAAACASVRTWGVCRCRPARWWKRRAGHKVFGATTSWTSLRNSSFPPNPTCPKDMLRQDGFTTIRKAVGTVQAGF